MSLTAGSVRAAGPVLHPRICATITAASCGAHLWLAVAHHHAAWLSALMVALAAVCLPCAVHIWRHSRIGALHQVTVSAVLMVAVHSVLLLGTSASVHGHAAGAAPGAADISSATGLLAVIALEITTALLAATLVARLRPSRVRLD